MNLLVLPNKEAYDNMMKGSLKKLYDAHFACYGQGNHFVIVKDRLGNRMGASITAPMLANILSEM
jgi:hypothetical protein